ncbi:unnamed protein product [Euphydryas editha]|uniref:DUF753 domain-containing protein n=1 Tax=Euphydryas editha TaxID=104508 RepID=A0AAU9U1W9_EUPED|nr:unnamed protein product [Euphydryas editha]
MILIIFISTISFTVGNLQKILDEDEINPFNNTNKLFNTKPLSITLSGQDSKNEYPYYIPKDDIKIPIDRDLLSRKRNADLEQFHQQENTDIFNSNDKAIKEENNYKITSYDSDLRRSHSKELKEVDGVTTKRIKEPTKMLDISEMKKSRMMIIRHPRVCYACSSIKDPTCWSPSNKTTVKYCREPNTSCLSKIFHYEDTKHVIRDCGSTCTVETSLESNLVYKLCTICHDDLCNSAYSVTVEILIIFVLILLNIAYSY